MESTEGIYKLKVLWLLMPQDFQLIYPLCGFHFIIYTPTNFPLSPFWGVG